MNTYFISGHSDYTQDAFDAYYKPMIEIAVSQNATFVIGDHDGVAVMAQLLLIDILPKEERFRVKIFFKGNEPKNCLSSDFIAVGKFGSHEEASQAMSICSDFDIVCLDENKRSSMTASNVLRRFTPNFNFKKWLNKKESNKDFWKMIFNTEE